jgi:trimeric autotransporter adhesin
MRRRCSFRHRPLRLLCGLAVLCASMAAWASEYHGQVFFSGYPVPGVSVTVSQGAHHLSTVTDEQGLYEFPDLADGKWQIEIEMRGFTTLKGEVTVAPNAPQGSWELKELDLAQLLAQVKAGKPQTEPQLANRSEETPPSAPTPTAPSPEAAAEKAADGLLINGSTNNAATSQYSLASAFGNRRPGAKGLYNGGLGAVINNSVFDARPYSLAGLQLPKDQYSRVTMLATLGGPLKIPHFFYHGPNFFLAYQWTRDRDAANESGLVPDETERGGDLSGLLNPLGQPITIYNPATGLPFTGPLPVSPQAQALLKLYPLPNLDGNARYNYQTNVLNNTHVDSLQSRLDKTIGRRDEIYGGFGFRSSRADNANLFRFRDDTDLLGMDTNVNWAHQYQHHLYVVLGYHFTRLRTEITPEFANRENISGQAGIEGNEQSPQNWGPPSLAFASGIAALSDGNSEFNRNRTDAVSLKVSTTRRAHTIMFGGDFRKQEFNEYSQQNPRGTFTFTGAATQAPGNSSATTTGSDLADFLLGIPDASAVAFGNPDKYFRQPVYDAYVTDDFRARPELTINAGMRWEYGAPLTELYGRLVNLDIASGFAAALPVVAGDPNGPVTGTRYPSSLIRPDRRGFEPRVGISWRPIPASTLLVKAGYGIYDDTSIYLSSAELMAQQAPLSTSVTVANSATCPLTLAKGFRNCPGFTDDPYAVDPNLRVGYAQVWQASVQRDLPAAIVMTATYLGTKGTRGLQEFLPNTYPIGASTPCPLCPVGFVYRSSNGNSTRQAGELQLRRRLRSGFTASVDYTWAKAIDDDSQIGAQGHVESQAATALPGENIAPTPTPSVAQDWLNLNAERGLSTFDQRNLVKASLQYTTGMGLGGDTLMSGRTGRYLKEWTLMAQFNAGSGLPETPVFLATVPGTGVTGSIRPDRTSAPLYTGPPGYFLNSAAYTTPAAGQWGTARRNSITGPDQVSLDSSLARTFRVRTSYNLDLRVDATNVLNHVAFTAWNTTVNSTIFGLPAAANAMRSLQLTARLRF